MNLLVEELLEKRTLDDGKLFRLLESDDAAQAESLHAAAREVAEALVVFSDLYLHMITSGIVEFQLDGTEGSREYLGLYVQLIDQTAYF